MHDHLSYGAVAEVQHLRTRALITRGFPPAQKNKCKLFVSACVDGGQITFYLTLKPAIGLVIQVHIPKAIKFLDRNGG